MGFGGGCAARLAANLLLLMLVLLTVAASSSEDDHVVTIDLAPAMDRFDRAELVARVSSTHDRAVVCQTYLAERAVDDTLFECALSDRNVVFQPGHNFFTFELVSAVTGKRYARRLISGVYHPDTVLLDGDGGHAAVNTTTAEAAVQVVVGSAAAAALKVGVDWALDRLAPVINHPKPPPPAIVRTRIYGEGNWKPPPPPPSPPPPSLSSSSTATAAWAAAGTTKKKTKRPPPPPPTALVPYRAPWRSRAAARLSQMRMTPAQAATVGALGGLVVVWAAAGPAVGPVAAALLQAVPQSAAALGARARAIAASLLAAKARRQEQRRVRRVRDEEIGRRDRGSEREKEAGRGPGPGRVEYYTTVFGDRVPMWQDADASRPPPSSSPSTLAQGPAPSPATAPPTAAVRARRGPSGTVGRALRALLVDTPVLGQPRCPLRNLIPAGVRSTDKSEYES